MAKARILVVDDEANARAALRTILGEEGFAVSEASDGLEALEKLRADSKLARERVAAIERDDLQSLLEQLDPREREIISLRFGLVDDQPLTLDEVGRRFNLTRERIRQIEAKALTKLRHPCSAHHRRLVDALTR